MYRIILIIIYCSILSGQAYGQQKKQSRKALQQEFAQIRDSTRFEKLENSIAMYDRFLSYDLEDSKDLEAYAYLGKAFIYLRTMEIPKVDKNIKVGEQLIDAHQIDTLRDVLNMVKGLRYNHLSDYTESIKYLRRSFYFAKKYQKERMQRLSSQYLAMGNNILLRRDSARYYLDFFLLKSQEINSLYDIATAYRLYGDLERSMKNPIEAAKYFLKAYEISVLNKSEDVHKLLPYIASRMGSIYRDLGNMEKAIEYFDVYIENKLSIKAYHRLGEFLLAKASLLIRTQRLEEAKEVIRFFEKEAFLKINEDIVWHYKGVLGSLHFEEKNYDKAEQYLLPLLEIAPIVGQKIHEEILIESLVNLSKLFVLQKKYNAAIRLYKVQLKGTFVNYHHKKEFTEILAQCYEAQAQFKQANEYLKLSDIYRDSIDLFYKDGLTLTQEQAINEAKKANELTQLKLEKELSESKTSFHRTLLLSVLLVSLLFISLLFLWGRQRKLRLENSLVAVKQQLLKLQVNPHFIFNALNSIQNSVLTLKKEQSVDLISKFSKLIRQVLQNSDKVMVPIYEELQLLTNYMDLEKVRTKNKFDYDIQIGAGVDVYNEEVPSMILQLFIENSIWHGIIPKEEKGLIVIKFMKENHRLKVSIADNGIGRKMSAEIKTKDQQNKKSMGMKLVRQRIQALNKKYHTRLELKILNGKNGIGTQTLLIA